MYKSSNHRSVTVELTYGDSQDATNASSMTNQHGPLTFSLVVSEVHNDKSHCRLCQHYWTKTSRLFNPAQSPGYIGNLVSSVQEDPSLAEASLATLLVELPSDSSILIQPFIFSTKPRIRLFDILHLDYSEHPTVATTSRDLMHGFLAWLPCEFYPYLPHHGSLVRVETNVHQG